MREQETTSEAYFGTERFSEDLGGLVLTGGPMAKGGATNVTEVAVKKIKLGRNSRADVSNQELEGMMQSIKETGLLQPIGVVRSGTGYEICYGNRRFLACMKLGYTKIPAIVFKDQKDYDVDMKNLTENIQRRNIGLVEAGRYMQLLKEQKLSPGEIAVRLGVGRSYVNDCLSAFEKVPKRFQKDVVANFGGAKTVAKGNGKVTVNTARKIVYAKTNYKLNDNEVEVLFDAAKSDRRFDEKSINKYAAALKRKSKDPIGDVAPIVHVNIGFQITQEHRNALEAKYVTEGPFNSLSAFFKAILKGEKAVKVNILSFKD